MILQELVCIDLEFRWRKRSAEDAKVAWTLEDYVRELPELGSLHLLPAALIAEEYRVRWRFGDHPGGTLYQSRFPGRWDELQPMLCQVAEELGREEPQRPANPVIAWDTSLHDPLAPLLYQDYLVQEMIGAGHTGKVYRAWQRSLGRTVAIKFLRKAFLNDASAVQRFLREAHTIAQLRHPNIVSVHGLGRTPAGGYFMVLDFVEGGDLAKRIAAAPVAPTDAAKWVSLVAEAMGHAHARGIVHCDLKPANLLLDHEGQVFVVDFGLAHFWNVGGPLRSGIAGTAPFMAPEQVDPGYGPLAPTTDIYALGAVLYTLLTGKPPYPGRTLADVLAQVVTSDGPISPARFRSSLPPQIVDACLRCLQKRPVDRYQKASELQTALGTAF